MVGEYVPKTVKDTGNVDQHGNAGYSVTFSDGSFAFMLAKKAPEVGVAEWGEIIDAPKKNKPNETYKKFVRVQKDEPKSHKVDSSDGMAWGNALTNATSLVIAFGDPAGGLGKAKLDVVATAKFLFDTRGGDLSEVKATDIAGGSPDDEQIDLDEIPF